MIIHGYYKRFIHFENAIYSKLWHVQIRVIDENNRKLTKFSAHATNFPYSPLGHTTV